jgi:serine phosphatase RsbU (regulator of sigma subunit)
LLVAAVVGALAIDKQRNPGLLLADLNQAVTSRTAGGFITACAARFYRDGRAVFANAGQISPYMDGREMELEAGLPLGITSMAQYDERSYATNGRTVTLMPDGVVEARNPKGELLGFERMAPLTLKTAAEIADAAQRWGQDDDITVLTVTLSPRLKEVLA